MYSINVLQINLHTYLHSKFASHWKRFNENEDNDSCYIFFPQKGFVKDIFSGKISFKYRAQSEFLLQAMKK